MKCFKSKQSLKKDFTTPYWWNGIFHILLLWFSVIIFILPILYLANWCVASNFRNDTRLNSLADFIQFLFEAHCLVWQYGLCSFQMGGMELERFLSKNQHTQRNFFNFENWTNREQKKLEKNKKIQKPKSCRQYSSNQLTTN